MNKHNWHKYLLEFLSIFIGVTLAFALNHWNEQKRDHNAEIKILKEISNGLSLDLKDIEVNKKSHHLGIQACQYFRDLLNNKTVDQSQLTKNYLILVRDFTSIMNLTGYESLKSKGLETIDNDKLRFEIISLYDYYYQIVYKLEETVAEMQSFTQYFAPINDVLSPYMIFDELGQLKGIKQPAEISQTQYNQVLSYLWRIENTRLYKIDKYKTLETKIHDLIQQIEQEISS